MTEENKRGVNLYPAKWIWVPSGRTLPNTFAKFKHIINVHGEIASATGYVLGSSRYLMTLNGKRVQWGPAPADPRYEEADTLELTDRLCQGENILEFSVCFFGHGDGTWVTGCPGLIFKIDISYTDGTTEQVFSSRKTLAGFDNCHPAGQYKRWFLRALQEEYNAAEEGNIIYENAMELPGDADKPSVLNGYGDYLFDSAPSATDGAMLRKREIPMPEEYHLNGILQHCGTVTWSRSPDDWFRFRVPNSFKIREGLEVECEKDCYSFEMPRNDAAYLTFALPEQGVGFIDFEIEAPSGTVIEVMTQESHDKNKTLWLDSYNYCWTRFICKEGRQHFLSFDTESVKYMQLHIRNAKGKIKIINPGILRRVYPTALPSVLETEDSEIQELFDACINTLRNSAIETICDGMGRERQQYSGDGSHQVGAFSYLYGAYEPIVKRYFETFTDGMTSDGYYLDCWPGHDRTMRISQVQMGLSCWGPILDHTLQLILESYRHYLHSGNDELLRKSYRDFLKFYRFATALTDEDGLLRVEKLEKVYIWIDHTAFAKQRDKRCVYNLYFAGMLENGLAPVCEHFGDFESGQEMRKKAEELVKKTKALYYDKNAGIFKDNLPYAKEDGYAAVSDRTLATALLFGYCDDPMPSLKLLKEMPSDLGKSYPANMVWIYRALGKYGETDTVTEDFKKRWCTMASVKTNNTLQEFFNVETDTGFEMSHCPLAPVLAAYEVYAGLVCEEAGFKEFSVQPQLGTLKSLHFEAKTVNGIIDFRADKNRFTVTFPSTIKGYVRLKNGKRQKLKSGEETEIV